VRFTDLTSDQQCVLLNAVEEAYLFSVLNDCVPGQNWPERVRGAPRLAQIVEDLIDQGLVELTKDSDEEGQLPVDIPAEQVHAVLSDPANWWSPEGTRPFALAPTKAGLAVYTATSSTPSDADKQ
jgi:hypothetical protein